MAKQLKIAYLGNQIAWGGGAKSLLLMIRSLSIANYKLYLYVTNCASQEMKSEFEKYVEFVKITILPEIVGAQGESEAENLRNLEFSRLNTDGIIDFVNDLNENGIDILHINNSVFSPVYKYIRENTSVKIITHIREWIQWNGIHSKQAYIIENIIKFSDVIICISDNEASAFCQHPACHVIPNPFDFDEIKTINDNRNQVKLKLGINPEWFLVGMMSSFQENKGIIDFLKTLVYLKENKSDIRNLRFIYLGGELKRGNLGLFYLRKILGKNLFLNKLLYFIKSNRIEKEVISISNRQNVYEVINCFDIAVRPSLSGDPWGRDIIEYMALGKPIIATGSSGFYIKNGITGYLVPKGDFVQLGEMVYQLMKDESKRKAMSLIASDIIFDACNTKKYSKKIIEVYDMLMLKK
jgi:glycosyltransferase involved in cell wall biosynthesis